MWRHRRGLGIAALAAIIVAMILKPIDGVGSFGRSINKLWQYYCEDPGCESKPIPSSERLDERRRPPCPEGHGRMTGEEPPRASQV